jgi:glycosyltransferase involved in cell wall biosynthesis
MRIVLIEPYCGGSHQAWAEGYAEHSRHQVDLLTLPPRFWKWRMQGGAATLAERARDLDTHPDLLLVTDMLNLPAFLGLTRRLLGNVPVALYCHENQLTYPLRPGERRDLTYAMINWLSMLAADRVLFNSAYHMEAWFEELPRLLKHFPDYTHLHRVSQVRARAEALPVGCNLVKLDRARTEDQREKPPLILWNQRWEYDKDPESFFRALDLLAAEGMEFRVALAGPNVRQMPEEFEAGRERLGERVIHFGWADRATYARLLWQADVVISTALHEFFGVAVVEAIYCRCFPVLPQRLAYPGIVPASYHGLCLYEDFDGLLERLTWALIHRDQAQQIAGDLRSAVAHLDWERMAHRYDEVLEHIGRREK